MYSKELGKASVFKIKIDENREKGKVHMKLAKLALIGAVSLTSVAAVGTSAFAEEKANMKSKPM